MKTEDDGSLIIPFDEDRKRTGGPVHPVDVDGFTVCGMDLLDLFAAFAMQTVVKSGARFTSLDAEYAYDVASKMVAEKSRRQPQFDPLPDSEKERLHAAIEDFLAKGPWLPWVERHLRKLEE